MSAASERFTLDTNLLVYALDSTAGISFHARLSSTLFDSIVG